MKRVTIPISNKAHAKLRKMSRRKQYVVGRAFRRIFNAMLEV